MFTTRVVGTVEAKGSGTTLTIPSATLYMHEGLVVSVGSRDEASFPISVTWGQSDLRKRLDANNVSDGRDISMWLKGSVNKPSKTADIVVTWGSAINSRAMTAIAVSRSFRKDAGSTKIEDTSTATPGTGKSGFLRTAGAFVVGELYEIDTVGTTDFTLIGAASNTVGEIFTATGIGTGTGTARTMLSFSTNFAICSFVSRGPVEDTPGTPQIFDGSSMVNVEGSVRDGTSGGGALSNTTIHTGWLQLTSNKPTRSRIQNATSRKWVNGLIVLREIVPADTVLFVYEGSFEQLLDNNGLDGQRALVLFFTAFSDLWSLPEVVSSDDLTALNMTLTEYQTARTLLQTEGLVTLESDGTITPLGFEP